MSQITDDTSIWYNSTVHQVYYDFTIISYIAEKRIMCRLREVLFFNLIVEINKRMILLLKILIMTEVNWQ